MAWLAEKGARIFIPLGHSPDIDLIAEKDGQLLRIEVKTSTRRQGGRWSVQIATNGGNQSWSGVTKYFQPERCEFLFVVVGDGRRWLIPSGEIDGRASVRIGGPKYSRFEIEPGAPLSEEWKPASTIDENRGGAGVGEPGRSVKSVPSLLSGFDSHPPHSPPPPLERSKYERRLGKSGHAVINQKRRLTIPQGALFDSGLEDGNTVRVSAEGPGRILVERAELPGWARVDRGSPHPDDES